MSSPAQASSNDSINRQKNQNNEEAPDPKARRFNRL
jgi:hypothetical protein